MMNIEIQAGRDYVTLRCRGRLVLGPQCEALRWQTMSRRESCVWLDMSEVRTLDAAGLGLLVELHRWAERHGQILRIANPSTCVRRLVSLVGLEAVLDIEDADSMRIRLSELTA